jgi:NifB/MoaA-like Fe-S oxidoreductase
MEHMSKKHVIDRILPGSIAEEMELEKGDILISINGKEVEDVFDYRYLINDEYLEVVIQKADGEEWELEIEKEYNEDLGI